MVLFQHTLGKNKRGKLYKSYGTDITPLYEEAEVRALNFQYEDIDDKWQKPVWEGSMEIIQLKSIHLGGSKKEEVDFLKGFQDTSSYSILMYHIPVTWIINSSLNEWDCDLVLSGHAHGGRIRIPFVGGLYAPDQENFCGKEA